MGSVWLARHIQLDMPVAIKFMDAALPEAADGRARFKREARSAALIRSPHVVQILDHGIDGEVPYIVMELLDGEHLGARLKREGRISVSAASVIATQVAKALRRAHAAGIIHRDLKPANIFLARSDEDEIVKILDFGIAKATIKEDEGSEPTKTGVLMGSPNYMSPEQARGSKSIDYRSDLWSLGVILFRAITGEPAFSGESEVDTILNICVGPIPVPSAVAPDLPREIDTFFERALARVPAERFQSAREMAAELCQVVARMGPAAEVAGPRRAASADKESATAQGSGNYEISKPSLPAALPLWRRLLDGAMDSETAVSGGGNNVRRRLPPPPEGDLPTSDFSADDDEPSRPSLLHDPPVSSRASPVVKSSSHEDPPASSHESVKPGAQEDPQSPLRAALAGGSKPRDDTPAPFRASLFRGSFSVENSPAAKRASMLARSRPLDEPSSLPSRFEKSLSFEPPQASMHASALARLSSIEDPFAAMRASGVAKLTSPDDSPQSTRRGVSEDQPSIFARILEAGQSPKAPPEPPPPDPSVPISRRFDQGFVALKTALQNSTRGAESAEAEVVAKISRLVDEGFAALKTGDRETTRRCWRDALVLDPTNRRLELNLRKLETKIG
jgi:serine/threonine-protein kinase